MKIFIILSISCLIACNIFAQFDSTAYKKEIYLYRSQESLDFADSTTSPLKKEDLMFFKGLDYFTVNPNFRIEAILTRTPEEIPFIMKTTTTREPVYRKFGTVSFTFNNTKYSLNVYQNMDLIENEEYKDYLFLPFTDLTNGESTYYGGRYLDLTIPENDTLIVDFNKCYNPYCAYNEKYSCPVPPKENHLEIAIEAGVKKFIGSH